MTSQLIKVELLNDVVVTVPFCSISRLFISGTIGSRVYGMYVDGVAEVGMLSMESYQRVETAWYEWMDTYRPGKRADLEMLQESANSLQRVEALVQKMTEQMAGDSREIRNQCVGMTHGADIAVKSLTKSAESVVASLAEATEKSVNMMVKQGMQTLENAVSVTRTARSAISDDAKDTQAALKELRDVVSSVRTAFRDDLFVTKGGALDGSDTQPAY